MKKLFFRYFISIFSIAVVVLLVQFGVLLLQYRTSQNRWKNEVYDDFVVSVENAITGGDFTDYGLNGIMMAVSDIDDNRVSGFLLRDASGTNMLAFGKTNEGRMLTSLFPSNQRFQNQGVSVRPRPSGPLRPTIYNCNRLSVCVLPYRRRRTATAQTRREIRGFVSYHYGIIIQTF